MVNTLLCPFFLMIVRVPNAKLGNLRVRITFSWLSENGEEKGSFLTFGICLDSRNLKLNSGIFIFCSMVLKGFLSGAMLATR